MRSYLPFHLLLFDDPSHLDCSKPRWEFQRTQKSEQSKHEALKGGDGEASKEMNEYFYQSLPPTLSSLLFCTGVQFFHISIHAFNDQIKIQENRGLRTATSHSTQPPKTHAVVLQDRWQKFAYCTTTVPIVITSRKIQSGALLAVIFYFHYVILQ